MGKTSDQNDESILNPAVRAKLAERIEDLRAEQVFLLPRTAENGVALYSEFDTEARKIARSVGLDADFLFKSAERGYLHEYSADWLIAFAIAVGQDISVDAVRGIGAYILTRIRGLVSEGAYGGEEEQAPIKVTIQRVSRGVQGDIEIAGLCFEGEAQAVIDSIRETITPIANPPRPRQIEQHGDGA